MSETTATMTQYAPYPQALADLVERARYRPGWSARLRTTERDPADTHGHAAGGLTLIIHADVMDTYQPEVHRPVNHAFIVPAATYNEQAWLRWLFECFQKVERHECAEWFHIADKDVGPKYGHVRPFAPTHGPGDDPYTIKELASDTQRRTSFRGVVKV